MAISSVVLSEDQQLELSRIAQSRSLPTGYVFRARVVLMLAEGASFSAIKQRLRTTAPTTSRWKQRFLTSGIDGLDTYHPGQTAPVLTPTMRDRILLLPDKAEGWLYPLEFPEARLDSGPQQGRYPSRIERGRIEAAPP
jgi:Homeodomain-like domain